MSLPGTPTIVLMGLRGSGKSTLGRLLAADLARPFVDLDDRTARLLGFDAAGPALRAVGEPAFRAAETRALAGVLEGSGLVVALGGGTPTAPGAADLLDARRADGRARTVYLRAEPRTLTGRLASDATDRPSLTGRAAVDEVAALFEARDPLYRRLADRVVEVDGLEAPAVLRAVRAWADDS